MLSPEDVYSLILGLVETNDADLLEELTLKSQQDLPYERIGLYRQIRDGMCEVLRDYDYTVSPEFQESVAGKSEATRILKERFESDPVKRRKRFERFVDAVGNLPRSNAAYQLLEPAKHHYLDQIITATRALASANVG